MADLGQKRALDSKPRTPILFDYAQGFINSVVMFARCQMSKTIICLFGMPLLVLAALPGCADTVEHEASDALLQLETVQKASFKTQDGITITSVVGMPPNISGRHPAVIFIHQGGSNKEEWTAISLFQHVIDTGMIALAYDVRGHGNSGGKGGVSLYDDPNRAPLDLRAAIAFLQDNEHVDKNRIAIVGSSIGANLALVGVSRDDFEIKTAVAMSGKTSAWINLAGGDAAIDGLSSIFVIASEGEQGGKRAAWAQEIYNLATPPRKLEIVKGSSAHGTEVLEHTPELQERIINWLKAELK